MPCDDPQEQLGVNEFDTALRITLQRTIYVARETKAKQAIATALCRGTYRSAPVKQLMGKRLTRLAKQLVPARVAGPFHDATSHA